MTQEPEKKKRKAGPGRPKAKIDYAKAEALAARGMERQHISRCLGISTVTMNTHLKKDKKFAEAMERGTAAGIAAVTGMLMKNINLGNMTGIIFYLKCRAGWKETQVVVMESHEKSPTDFETMEEAERLYKEFMPR